HDTQVGGLVVDDEDATAPGHCLHAALPWAPWSGSGRRYQNAVSTPRIQTTASTPPARPPEPFRRTGRADPPRARRPARARPAARRRWPRAPAAAWAGRPPRSSAAPGGCGLRGWRVPATRPAPAPPRPPAQRAAP